jgi:DNA-directed RNA polymerase specialized sigma24 family protein
MAQNGSFTGDLEDLYRGRYRYFLRVATAIVGDEASGHDAVQDGFAQALREQQSFRGEGPLEAWVWRIVVNAALALLVGVGRPAARLRRLWGLWGRMEHADESSVRVVAQIDSQPLPLRQRGHPHADLDYRSIAHALGVEVGTVSATLSSAHEALRRSMKEVER